MAVWEFNIGEWTEAYVFLKLLGDGRIYGANAEFEKDDLTYIDIINIIKDEPNQYLRFERLMNDEVAEVQALDKENIVFKVITAPELQNKAAFLYNTIKKIKESQKKKAKGEEPTNDETKELKAKNVTIPEIEEYLRELRFTSPKANLSDRAKDLYGKKADIVITSEDSYDHTRSVVGFSIKSFLGSKPTLFNMTTSSSFVYKVTGCTIEKMHNLNLSSSFKGLVKDIKKENCSLEFVKCRNIIFEDNLAMVDTQMTKILSASILIHCNYYDTLNRSDFKKVGSSDLSDIVIKLSEINPINVRKPIDFYTLKFKDLLFSSFAGLTASTEWNGRKKLSGGYIDVDKNGEMLYFRAISDDVFCNYLYKNTKMDLPQRGSLHKLAVAEAKAFKEGKELSDEEKVNIAKKPKKGDYGYIYYDNEDGEYYLNINFQIRFK